MKLSFKLMAIYAAYYETILQDSIKSSKMKICLASIGVLAEGDLLMKYAENGCSVIAVSAASHSIGKIVNSNSAFCELSGYTKKEIRSICLDKLIPQIYREKHYAEFNQACFGVQLEQNIEFSQKSVFIQDKAGYIFPVIIRVVATPNLGNDYCFFAKIIKDKANNDFIFVHILTNIERKIFAISSSKYFL